MPDWLALTNGVLAIPLQIAGFGFAFFQIHKTRKAANAARDAITATQDHIGKKLLLVILPQLSQVETQLEWAVTRNDREAVKTYLASWRWQAGQVRGHLEVSDRLNEELSTAIQSSIAAAADTKLALLHSATDVTASSKAAQVSIAQVTGMLGELTARNSLDGKGNETHG